jgi:hypothetical protein
MFPDDGYLVALIMVLKTSSQPPASVVTVKVIPPCTATMVSILVIISLVLSLVLWQVAKKPFPGVKLDLPRFASC